MELTAEQRDMLEGRQGEALGLCLKSLVQYGSAFGATRLVPIVSAHLTGSFKIFFYSKYYELLGRLLREGVRVRVPTTLNPRPGYDFAPQNRMVFRAQRRHEEQLEALGVTPNYSCVSYLYQNVPRFGEILGWAESSAVIWANSVAGARTNRNSIMMDVCQAVTGLTPEFGYLRDEHRRGQLLVRLDVQRMDAAALGFLVGRLAVDRVPVLEHWPFTQADLDGVRDSQDVHQVNAKPSLVARARTADLVVANGAELEMGWLPVLLRESANPRIQPGNPGYFEAASAVRLVDVPTSVDRAMGDIHAQGNPHIQLDPRNIAAVAKALSSRFATIDPANATYYQSRATDFQARWSSAMARWDRLRAPLKGAQVVVIHKDQAYLCRWLGLEQAATTEPKPVVPPSAGYLAELVLGYALAFASYLVGLAASVVTDLPSSAVIVWAMAVLGILWHLTARGNGGQLR